MATDTIYEKRDVKFRSAVKDKHGAPIALSTFADARYIIVSKTNERVLTKTFSEGGITKDGDDWVIHIDDTDNLLTGGYRHQLTVIDLQGNVLPPTFQRTLRVKPVLE